MREYGRSDKTKIEEGTGSILVFIYDILEHVFDGGSILFTIHAHHAKHGRGELGSSQNPPP